MVPDTDSMDFKVGELLKDLQLDPLATKTIDRALSSIIDAINNIPDQKAGSEYAAGFLRDLRVPSDKVNFTFKSPETIRIGGSYSIGCVAKPDINVDLLIRMPKDCFHEKDYLNHRYHAKRCIYLCVIEKSLRSSPLVRRIEWRTFRNQARKPVIHLYPAIKHADLSEFFIRIIPTASSVFNTSKLRISRNNVRAFNHGDTSRATPYYNSSILEDMSIEENADFVKNTFNEWKTLGDALLLLKVWARNRTSIYTHDCLNGYLLSIILSYLAAGPGGNHINKSMKAMHIFRVTLKFMSSNQWEKGLSLQSLSKSKLSSEEMIECLQTFPVVLFDATGHTNLLFCLTRTAFAELQDETAWTVTCIDKCRGGGFEEVFMTKVDLAAKFDACLRINFKGNATVKSFDFCLDDERWGLVEKHVQSVLQQGLSDRAKLVRVNWRSAPSYWNINEGFENFGEEPMLVGLLLSSEEKCVRVVDIGPHAENKEEADKFRKFWGERAELRRFRDGTIAESTVWECPPWQRHLIVKRITEYVIYKHFRLSQEDLLYVVDQLDFSLHLSGKDPISSSTSLMEAFETLSKRLRLLEIPLRISSVQPLDAAFRHTAVFPPEPHPLVYEKGIAKKIPKFTTTCIKPLTVMIQLEGSGNWPLDAKVIEKTKVAFLLKICESLQDRWGMLCSATEHEVNVLMGGYAFSLKILHERSLHLLRSNDVAGNDTIKGKRYIDEELFLRSQHSSMINGLNGRYPAYGSVVRLAKRWVSSHLFSSFFEEEAIELIVAYLFLRPFPFHAPLTRITGFLRFLRLISNYDWTFSPLIIDLNGDFTPQDEWEINENLLSSRKSSVDNVQNLEPAMFLATTYDKTSKAWTKFLPNGEILRRMDAYARSSADLLTKLILHGQNGPYTWECLFRTPMNNYDAVVVLHRDKLAYPQRLLFPSSTCHGKHVIQGKESKDFNPFIQFGDAVKSPEDARSKLLVNFDPTMFFLEDLKEEFPETFEIWYDALGGDTIGLTWDLKKRKRENYDGDEEELINKLKGVGEVGKGFVKSVYFLKAPKLQV